MNYYDMELFHSETYLGADYSDGLQHFKYIRRYRNRKGKWTYVYANKETHNRISTNLFVARNNRADQKAAQGKSDYYFHQYERFKNDDPKFAKRNLEDSVEYQSNANHFETLANEREIHAYADIQRNSVSNLSEKSISEGKEAIRKTLKQLSNVKWRH